MVATSQILIILISVFISNDVIASSDLARLIQHRSVQESVLRSVETQGFARELLSPESDGWSPKRLYKEWVRRTRTQSWEPLQRQLLARWVLQVRLHDQQKLSFLASDERVRLGLEYSSRLALHYLSQLSQQCQSALSEASELWIAPSFAQNDELELAKAQITQRFTEFSLSPVLYLASEVRALGVGEFQLLGESAGTKWSIDLHSNGFRVTLIGGVVQHWLDRIDAAFEAAALPQLYTLQIHQMSTRSPGQLDATESIQVSGFPRGPDSVRWVSVLLDLALL